MKKLRLLVSFMTRENDYQPEQAASADKAMGARKAFSKLDNLDERDRWLRLPYAGIDGVPKTGQASVPGSTLVATVVVPPTAGRAMTTMTQALQTGSKPPERLFTTPESFPAVAELATR